jgi:hypothetical protein
MSRERRRDNNRKSINEKRNILKNADISIKNNTTSRIILKSQIGGGSIYILANNGDIEDVPFNELHDIFKRHRKLFEEFKIIIEDVYCPDNDEMTIEDVKMVLGLKERGVEEVPDEYYLDEVLLDFSLDEYEEEVNSLPKSVINRLLDRAIILYKQGEFSNFNKMSLLEKKLGIEYVFEDIDRSMRPVRSDIDLL